MDKFYNNVGMVVKVYRNNSLVFTADGASIQEYHANSKLEKNWVGGVGANNAVITDIIYMKPFNSNGDIYSPLADDEFRVSNTTDGLLDGYYQVKQYAGITTSKDRRKNFISLAVRALGPKKAGDTNPNNNSAKLRIGSLNGAN